MVYFCPTSIETEVQELVRTEPTKPWHTFFEEARFYSSVRGMQVNFAQVVLLDTTQITKIKVWEETKPSRGSASPKNQLVLINYDAEKLLEKFAEIDEEKDSSDDSDDDS